MPKIHPHNVSPSDGYSTYLEELDVLLSPEAFVDLVLNQLHKCNWIYWTYLEQVKELNPQAFAAHVLREVKIDYLRYMPYLNDVQLIDPDGYAEYVSFEIEACYAIKMADEQQQQFKLRAQIQRDEEKAERYLSALLLDDENTVRKETAIQIYEFFSPEYDDGVYPAKNVTELDHILAARPRHVKPRSKSATRRKKTIRYKRRLQKKAIIAQKNYIRRLDNDVKFTGNCAGFVINKPTLATTRATHIWKRAQKNGLVVGDICPDYICRISKRFSHM